jgi:uncharacterized protein
MDSRSKISRFLEAPAFGVVGASDNPRKFGHKCYACYLEHQKTAYPVNPHVQSIFGNPVYPTLAELPEKVESISIITPPPITEEVIDQAIECGVKNIWMQPGAESQEAIRKAEEAGINVIAGGPCLLIELGYSG